MVGRFAYGVSDGIRASIVSSRDLCSGGCAGGVCVFRYLSSGPSRCLVLASTNGLSMSPIIDADEDISAC